MNPDIARPVQPLPAGGVAPSVNERLCHLFRASLKNGCIHPLYLPILKYRHAQAGA
jgi:hypothetical protein